MSVRAAGATGLAYEQVRDATAEATMEATRRASWLLLRGPLGSIASHSAVDPTMDCLTDTVGGL